MCGIKVCVTGIYVYEGLFWLKMSIETKKKKKMKSTIDLMNGKTVGCQDI